MYGEAGVRVRHTRENAGEGGKLVAPLPPLRPMARWGTHWKCDCGFVNKTDPEDCYPQCLFCKRVADEMAI